MVVGCEGKRRHKQHVDFGLEHMVIRHANYTTWHYSWKEWLGWEAGKQDSVWGMLNAVCLVFMQIEMVGDGWVAQSRLTLYDPMDCSTPGLPVLHYLLGVSSNSCILSQWYHPTISSLLPPSPPTLDLSQHQCLFQWVSSLHQVAKVLELQLQHQSFQWIFKAGFLYHWLLWSLQSKGLSRVFSRTTIRTHQFFGAQPLLWSHSHIHTWLLENL